jgi:acetolactate synthase-1/2/3 large subunit
MQLTGAQALIKSLEMEGVEVMFGLPGGAILPVYDPIIDSSIRHILVRHEQGAGHMAEGYAHATGRPGVAMVTSGPAATNIGTPLCDAYMDSIPMVCITGQVAYSAVGTDAFQECDTTGITMSVTKHNWLVTKAQDIPLIVREAFHLATTGRPGPVLIDVPKDVSNTLMDWYWPSEADVTADLPGYRPTTKGHPKKIKDAARLILEARRPEGAGRPHRHPRRHHAHGPGLLPRQPPAVPRHAGHARQLHGRHLDAEERPAHRPGQPLRRPHHRQGRHLRP